jgi:hypothetical protein
VFVTPFPTPPPGTHVPPALTHTQAVRCVLPLGLSVLGEPYVLTGAGDAIRAYDLADADAPVLLAETDAHAHDVTALRLWVKDAAGGPEAWVVSASLDGTLRRWKLAGMCAPVSAHTCWQATRGARADGWDRRSAPPPARE